MMLNSLTPKSDQHLISPYNITPESNIKGHENKGNDHQLKKFYIANQILLVSTLENVQMTARRKCILMLGCKGFKNQMESNLVLIHAGDFKTKSDDCKHIE